MLRDSNSHAEAAGLKPAVSTNSTKHARRTGKGGQYVARLSFAAILRARYSGRIPRHTRQPNELSTTKEVNPLLEPTQVGHTTLPLFSNLSQTGPTSAPFRPNCTGSSVGWTFTVFQVRVQNLSDVCLCWVKECDRNQHFLVCRTQFWTNYQDDQQIRAE